MSDVLKQELLSTMDVNTYINLDDLDEDLMDQIKNVSSHPARALPVIILPDSHLGYGMPIGCVLATKGAVVPNSVGVDIGCSMSLVKTSVRKEEVTTEQLETLVSNIYNTIPVGTNHNKEKQSSPLFDEVRRWSETTVCSNEFESAQYQLGTLGGGNHFIEIQEGTDGFIYIMIHSGSRNLGYKVCEYYNKMAEDKCTRWFHSDVVENKLAFFPKGSPWYDKYMKEMSICLDFAKANHFLMQRKVQQCMNLTLGKDIEYGEKIYTRHNYASMEHHHNQNVLVHRKGAILVREGMKAIIPGSQGTASYVVEGLGNPASLCSASHGSGRKMSRRRAKAELSLADEQAKMTGIIHRMNSVDALEEAPSAYKDIEDVIQLESALVKPVLKLKPLAVVKG